MCFRYLYKVDLKKLLEPIQPSSDFLCFPFFIVKLDSLQQLKKCVWCAMDKLSSEKMEKICVSEEKSLSGLALGFKSDSSIII
jgi:hypothetical protein